jgi:hypothetical protein
VGKARINQDLEGRVADVGVLGNYAYLAAWSAPDCQKGGVYVMDISNPAAPKQINFIRTGLDSYSGEGIQAVHLSTPFFTGDLLAFNNEDCVDNAGKTSAHSHGGATFVDVTNPKVHKYLAEGVGDKSRGRMGPATEADAHEIHSVFVWEDEQGTRAIADDKAYAVIVDNEELFDVDILDITDPRQPRLIAEYDLNLDFPEIVQADLGTAESFLHDMIVKEIRGRQVMLLSYWDGGYVQLDVENPLAPKYIADSDFANPDTEAAESGLNVPPEGSAHQAEFSKDNNYVVAADEDFDAYKASAQITSGPFAGHDLTVVQASDVPQISPGVDLVGESHFVGLACSAVPAAPAGVEVAIIERGVCDFQVKAENVVAAGYEGGIVFNRTGVDGCETLIFMGIEADAPFVFVSRSDGFRILGVYDSATYACSAGDDAAGTPAPPANTPAHNVDLSAYFDGWGYVHLYNAKTMRDLDTYAIPEAHDPEYASGFGDLSVHEVAMSEKRNDLAYFSYYTAGFRVARIVDNKLVEVGHFIDGSGDHGNNFWGVQVWQKDGKEYVLASDRDFGLYIFEYTGAGGPNG